MPERIFITGLPGSGKSSLVGEIVKELKIKAGGIATPEIRVKGTRKGFKIIDLETGREGVLASTDIKGKPRLGKYGVNIKDIDEIGIKAIENALENPRIKLLVIDELGAMEMLSKNFEIAVEKALDSKKNLLIVLHRRFVGRYRDKGRLFFLKEENREQTKKEIMRILK